MQENALEMDQMMDHNDQVLGMHDQELQALLQRGITVGAGSNYQSSTSASPPAHQGGQHSAGAYMYDPTERTESNTSSSPNMATLGVDQTWVVPEGWGQMDWLEPPTGLQLDEDVEAIAEALGQSGYIEELTDDAVHRPAAAPAAPAQAAATAVPTMAPIAELAAESLLNLHSTPLRAPPSTGKRQLLGQGMTRPTPLRRFTLGSSIQAPSSSEINTTGVAGSDLIPLDTFPAWYPDIHGQMHIQLPGLGQKLDTPISLRPRAKRTQSQTLSFGPEQGMRGRMGIGERSLSFSAGTGADDPFEFLPEPERAWGREGKENVYKDGDMQVGQRESRGHRHGEMLSQGETGLGKGENVKSMGADQGGSPLPRKRFPLGTVYPPQHPHQQHPIYAVPSHSQFQSQSQSQFTRTSRASTLSSTLLPPNPLYQNPSGSPIKKTLPTLAPTGLTGTPIFATPITARRSAKFGHTNWPASTVFTPLFGQTGLTPSIRERRPGSGGDSGRGEGEDGRNWMLSSPAVDGIAAELGLVGAYGYVRGIETPMRGMVGAETPARDSGKED